MIQQLSDTVLSQPAKQCNSTAATYTRGLCCQTLFGSSNAAAHVTAVSKCAAYPAPFHLPVLCPIQTKGCDGQVVCKCLQQVQCSRESPWQSSMPCRNQCCGAELPAATASPQPQTRLTTACWATCTQQHAWSSCAWGRPCTSASIPLQALSMAM